MSTVSIRDSHCPELLPSRFWSKVSKRKPSECWPWMATRTPKGYGQFGVNRKVAAAHRVAFELEVGDIPEGMQVLHRCDNPSCVNPKHLFLGTNKDNHDDKIAKNRQAKGERAGGAILCINDVEKIRKCWAAGWRICNLARMFSVSQPTIVDIIKRRTWDHIDEMY